MKAKQDPGTIWSGKKEHAKKMAEWWNEQPYYLAHNETGKPTFRAVRCRYGWRVRKSRHFYPGTVFSGHKLLDGEWARYLSPLECEMYMEPHSGGLGLYDEWSYWEQTVQNGCRGYVQIHAVDNGEVEPVEWDGEKWVEWAP